MAASVPARAGTEAVLHDGSRVVVRPVTAVDERPLLEFLRSLSLDSRYFRFFSLCPDLARMAHSSIPAGDERCFGLVALPPGRAEVVGHAGCWCAGAGRAEMAIAVADRLRRAGLGSLLLRGLAERAVLRGIDVLEMDVLMANHAAMRLLGSSGFPLQSRTARGVALCELFIGPGPATSLVREGV